MFLINLQPPENEPHQMYEADAGAEAGDANPLEGLAENVDDMPEDLLQWPMADPVDEQAVPEFQAVPQHRLRYV